MTMKMGFRDALERMPVELRKDARDALLVLSQHLYEIDEQCSAFGTEARVIWIDAQVMQYSPNGLRSQLVRVAEVKAALERWNRKPAAGPLDDFDSFVQTTIRTAEAVQRALFALVDHVRSQVMT